MKSDNTNKQNTTANEIIAIKSYISNETAEIEASMIADAGYEFFLSDMNVTSLNLPTGGASNCIKLHVRRRDAESVLRLLNATSNRVSSVSCPKCGSTNLIEKPGFMKSILWYSMPCSASGQRTLPWFMYAKIVIASFNKSGEIMPSAKKATFRDFPFTYYIAIIFEFFERGSYYGVMSILSVYMTDQLGFAKTDVGLIKGTIQPLLYFLPILTGAIADRMGYRKTLMIAFSLLGLGYLATSQVTDYNAVFIALVVMGIGAGTFKPVISGTIAKVTDERTSTLGFGIFYWTINLGAFLFPLILVPILKSMDWSYVLIAAGICTGAMLLPTIFIYKEPAREEKLSVPFLKILEEIFLKIWLVLKDWRFILFVFIYSWFWILYFQMFDSVLWYVKAFVDPTPLNTFVNSLFGTSWKFDIEHVTVINAGTIIMLQLWISSLVKNTRALPTMLVGIAMATLGMAILSLGTSIWIFLTGIIIFSTGEMTAHPKFISYLGLLAPEDKKATYMGFGFLYGVFGSFFGGIIGANLYVGFVDNPMIAFVRAKLEQAGQSILLSAGGGADAAIKAAESIGLGRAEIQAQADPTSLWLVFSSIGVLCIAGLLAYQRFLIRKK